MVPAFLAICLLLTPPGADPFTAAGDAAAGDALARRMVEALGGAAWPRLRHVAFAFEVERGGERAVSRRHDWDPQRGVARVRWGEGEARRDVVLRLADRSGFVRAGARREVTADAAVRDAALQEAFAHWTNDTYWLVAPLKVFDPGARRADVAGALRISFEAVGLTPGDRYLYDLAADGRPSGWRFRLEGGREGAFRFEEPHTEAGVTVFRRKASADGQTVVHHPFLRLSEQAEPRTFEPL